MAIRLALLAHHYRDDWEYTDADLTTAVERLAAWRLAAARANTPDAEALLEAVRMRLEDDLDAPGALSAVDAWAADSSAVDGASEPDGAALMRATVDALLGIAL
jgi:L-cysteine:1D-myo-inositol 2-amino-2-deoxy-alpha-D-glucopyranoside ligase